MALVVRGRDPDLLVRFLERGNVNEYSWLDHASTWKEGDDMAEVTLRCVRARPAQDRRTREAGWFLTAAMSEALSAGLADARIVDASRLIAQVRLIKSEAEVGCLRRAGEIAEIEQRTAPAAMHDGVLETEVATAQSHGRTLSRR